MIRTIQVLFLLLLAVASAQGAARLHLSRSMESIQVLPGQVLWGELRLENHGNAPGPYDLLERLPAGVTVVDAGGGQAQEEGLVWQGTLAAGETVTYRYRVSLSADAPDRLPLRAEVRSDAPLSYASGADGLTLFRMGIVAMAATETPSPYAGDEVPVTVTLSNPLEQEVEISLQLRQSPSLQLVQGEETLRLPPRGAATAEFLLLAESPGRAVFAAVPVFGGVEAGNTAAVSLEVLEAPTLPEALGATELSFDLGAAGVPGLTGLVFVMQLPEGVYYLPQSVAVNGQAGLEPSRANGVLIFELPPERVSLSFAVTGNLTDASERVSLLALTPEPELLSGDPEGLALYLQAPQALEVPAQPERAGSVILEPYEAQVFRTRDRITVRADAPLDHRLSLYVNDTRLGDEIIGQRVTDSGLQRLTLDYVGVPLARGPNAIRLESAAPDGQVLTDELTVFFAGPPAQAMITPVSELVAGTATPLVFDVQVMDAWGNPPLDGLLTVDVVGAQVRTPDAAPQQPGYQLRHAGGVARLELQPLDTPGQVTIAASVGQRVVTERVVVGSSLRPWVVSGAGSVGVSLGEAARFGVQASLFAQGTIFEHYLLTVAMRHPAAPLGLPANPYQDFPVLGSSSILGQAGRSRDGLYLRLERDLSYLQYGDFDTDLEGFFLRFPRNYTGLSGNYASPDGRFNAFAYFANVAMNREVFVRLVSDGTSLYRLPDAPIEPGSLRLNVIKLGPLGEPVPDEDDLLLGPLEPLSDYSVHERVGIVTLLGPLPLTDELGRRYALEASYRLVGLEAAPRLPQYGAQLHYRLDGLSLRVGAYQNNLGEGFSRVVAAGLSFESGSMERGILRGDSELAYGQDASTGGMAFTARLRYDAERLSAEGSHTFYGTGFRSASVLSDASAGHGLGFRATYAPLPALSLSLESQLRYRLAAEAGWELSGALLANYRSEALQLGGFTLGQGFGVQIGLQVDRGQWRLLTGLSLRDLFGLSGLELQLLHRQGLGGATSLTDFSVTYQLLQNLQLRLTDRHEWGVGRALLLGLEADVNHRATAEAVCEQRGCELEPDANLGTTRVHAQYELPGGMSDEAARLRLGVSSRYPLADGLWLDGSFEQVMGLGDSSASETVASLGGSYSTEGMNASLRYEFRLASEQVKHLFTAGLNLALSDELYGSLSASYLYDSSFDVAQGFRLSAAAAYRGGWLDVLTHHNANMGAYGPGGQGEATGDLRLYLPFGAWTETRGDLRLAYLYRLPFGRSYQDMIVLGASLSPWEGGSLSSYVRAFHDWGQGDWLFGGGLELSQRFGCGLYGVAGYNLAGFGDTFGSMYTAPGLYFRLDVVFDEEWRCGQLGREAR